MKNLSIISVGFVVMAMAFASCQAALNPGDKVSAGQEARGVDATAAEAATVQSYPKPSIYSASTSFSLKAANTSIPVISFLGEYAYAEFSFSGTVSLEVTANQAITSYSISPLAKNITGTISGNTLTFSLSTSTYVIVTINDLPKLVIAADPLETNIPASSGSGIYNVTASPYNADKTGATKTSAAIQAAIDAAHNAGGGTVYVPAGVYKCGKLTLKSNVTLYLAGGSVIVCTGNAADYSVDFHKDSLNHDGTYLVTTTVGSSNITIRGRGTIDGDGVNMRNNQGFLTQTLVPMGTTNFRFDGVILRDGGMWSFMPVRSSYVTVTNYKAFQSLQKLEDDAFDVNECQNVTVTHAIGISDDDTFSTKTWAQTGIATNWPGTPQINDTVTFDDCLAWSRCVAFKIGQGTFQLQKNINFKNSYVYQCARGLVVDHSYGETAVVQDVTFDNIDIERV